jgi:hypothetical protein
MIPRAARLILVALLAAEAALLVFGPQAGDHLPAIAAAEADGKRPDWWHDAAMGVRYAAWISAGLLGVLLLTASGWTRSLSVPAIPNPPDGMRHPKWFWPLVICAVVLCLGLRLPLASRSLWWDEAWVIKEASHGKWMPDKKHEGELRFMAHDWKRCAWYYQKPTNHAPMSLLQKSSITAWQKITGAGRSEFSDLAARVPALLASLTAVLLLACLLRAWGQPGAGVGAAFLLALHPWHIRYGVDARAYALVVPLCLGGMFAVTRLADTGGRKPGPWAAWGAIEFLWLWAFPNAVFDVAAMNLVVAVLLWRIQPATRDRWSLLLRLLATNAFAAILFLHAFLPNVMQARRWAGQEADKHVLDLSLAAETLSQLFLGRSIADPGPRLPLALAAAALVAAALGILHARRRSLHASTWTLPALVAAAILFAGVTSVLQSYYYPRFAIALLPVLVAAFCLVLTLLGKPLLSMLVAGGFLASAAMPIASLLEHPIAPLHEVAAFVEKVSAKQETPPLVACYGLGREVMPVYHPRCIPLEKRAELAAALDQARTEKRGLFVISGYQGYNRAMLPDGFPLLDDPSVFEEVAGFPGIEPDFFFRVLRMK